MGSAGELEYLPKLSKYLNYLNENKYNILYNELLNIRRMLKVYIQKIKSKLPRANSQSLFSIKEIFLCMT